MNRTINDRGGSCGDINSGRRRFLGWLAVGVGALGAAVGGIPVLSYLLSPSLRKMTPAWYAVGPVESFELGATVHVAFKNLAAQPWAGATARTGAWLRRTGEREFIAFALNCTHLGCPVRWEPAARLFMCPCHGGVYYADGTVAAGPPPLPLRRFAARIRNGQVELQNRPIAIT